MVHHFDSNGLASPAAALTKTLERLRLKMKILSLLGKGARVWMSEQNTEAYNVQTTANTHIYSEQNRKVSLLTNNLSFSADTSSL